MQKSEKKSNFILISHFKPGLCSAVSSTSDCRFKRHESEPKLGHFTLVEIDHEIISTTYGQSPSAEARRATVVSYLQKYVFIVLVDQ